jgi:hypothetical protein
MSEKPAVSSASVEIGIDFDNHPIVLEIVGLTRWSKEEVLGKIIRLYLWAVRYNGELKLKKPKVAFQLISDENNSPDHLCKAFKEAGLLNSDNVLYLCEPFLKVIRPKPSIYTDYNQDIKTYERNVRNVRKRKENLIVEPVDTVDNSEKEELFLTETQLKELKQVIENVHKLPVGSRENNEIFRKIVLRIKHSKNVKNLVAYGISLIDKLPRENE